MRMTFLQATLALSAGLALLGCGSQSANNTAEATSDDTSIRVAKVDVVPKPPATGRVAPTPEVDPGNAPRVETPEIDYDFGEADPADDVQHDFVIRNVGKGPLVLGKPTTSCGCTVAALPTNTLNPGEETKISATLSLSGRHGPVQKSITVTSNDPKQPTTVFRIMGVSMAPIMFEPQSLAFGTIEDDDTHSQSLILKSTKADVEFNIVDIQHNLNDFDVDIETITPKREYKITMSNPAPLAPKGYGGRVTVQTDNPDYRTLSFNATARVVGDVAVQPDMLTLIAKDTPNATTDIAFRVDPGRVKNFEILGVEPPLPGIEYEVTQLASRGLPAAQSSSYLIKFKGVPQNMTLDGKAAIIRTSIPDRPAIEVPFQVRQLGGATVRSAATEPLIIRPKQITVTDRGDATADTPYNFFISAGTVKEFTVKSVDVPAEGVVTELTKLRENYWRVTLTNVPADMALNGKNITVETDGPTMSVPITVRGADNAAG